MKHLLLLSLLLLASPALLAQQTHYNDVAVIVNDNSPESVSIGNYFAQQRNMPPQNVIHISAPVSEVIDDVAFHQMRLDIVDSIVSKGLKDSLNYLVTTRGIPLKIYHLPGCPISNFQNEPCSSVDSELTLLLGLYDSDIGQPGGVENPYYNTSTHFARTAYHIYLVTRLDALNEADVYDLIDRSSSPLQLDTTGMQYLMDLGYYSNPSEYASFVARLQPGHDTLTNKGLNSTLHDDPALMLMQPKVGGLHVVSNSLLVDDLHHDWQPGSVAELLAIATAGTFDTATTNAAELAAAKMISNGATSVNGYAWNPYPNRSMDATVLFDRQTDWTAGYNLAEMYYQATKTLSYYNVLIADPKATIEVVPSTGIAEHPSAEAMTLYPNPANALVQINTQANTGTLRVFSGTGQLVMENPLSSQLDVSQLAPGLYVVQLNSPEGTNTQRLAIVDQ